MTYSGGQRGQAKPRSERESPIQSLLGIMFPKPTGVPLTMDRRTASQKYAAAQAQEEALTPLERAPVGTPMVLGGQLGFKNQAGEWQARGDMETSNVPIYDRDAGKYIYDGAMHSTPLITGLTPDGQVDRTQSDEYKSIRAQYDALRKRGESAMTPEGMREKALDYGLTEWAKLHPTLAARQQAGSFNPLMQSTFGYQTGEAPDQVQRSMVIGGQRYDVDPEAIQYQIDQQQTQDMNVGNPLMQSAEQQQLTAKRAAEATTTGMNRPAGYLQAYVRGMKEYEQAGTDIPSYRVQDEYAQESGQPLMHKREVNAPTFEQIKFV